MCAFFRALPIFSLLISPFQVIAVGVQLPVVDNEHRSHSSWWAKVGDNTLVTPGADSGLSNHVGDYYYAFGSLDALQNNALLDHRVGGSGHLHVFHLPNGSPQAALIQTSVRAGRRSSLSDLQQLKHGDVLQAVGFPVYTRRSSYVNPLDQHGHDKEKEAVNKLSADVLMQNLQELVDLPSHTRSYSNDQASAGAEAFIQKRFQEAGLKVCLQTYEFDGHSLMNIVGFLPGAESSSASDGAAIVGAHYDSRPYDGAAPGAEDNGSGVAALLGLVKAFSDTHITPKKPVYFVAFSGEEKGLLGSKQFAESLVQLGDTSLAVECRQAGSQGRSFLQTSALSRSELARNWAIIMDEVGWRSPKMENMTVNMETFDRDDNMVLLDTLQDASMEHNGVGLTVTHSPHPFGSDHMSFLDRNMVSVLTINGDDDAYPNYHKSSDTIDNVNKDLLYNIAKMNMAALVRIAGVHVDVAKK